MGCNVGQMRSRGRCKLLPNSIYTINSLSRDVKLCQIRHSDVQVRYPDTSGCSFVSYMSYIPFFILVGGGGGGGADV